MIRSSPRQRQLHGQLVAPGRSQTALRQVRTGGFASTLADPLSPKGPGHELLNFRGARSRRTHHFLANKTTSRSAKEGGA